MRVKRKAIQVLFNVIEHILPDPLRFSELVKKGFIKAIAACVYQCRWNCFKQRTHIHGERMYRLNP